LNWPKVTSKRSSNSHRENKGAGLDSQQSDNEMLGLAKQAAGAAEDSDLLSISADKLMKLGKSVKQTDRVLAAKLLRKLVSQRPSSFCWSSFGMLIPKSETRPYSPPEK